MLISQKERVDELDLTERQKRILRAVVETYVQTAEPVGSKSILAHSDLNVSSATIRNELAELTALGLLEQPHTSAGRVPAPKGYRFYVNALMEEHRLSVQETERLNEAMHLKLRELDRVMDEAGRIVSRLTQYPAFALSAGKPRVTVKRFDVLLVERAAFIAVVMTDNDHLSNRLFRLPQELSREQLQMLASLLNGSFTGLTLEEFTPQLIRAAAQALGDEMGLVSMVVSFAMEVLEEQRGRMVKTAGLDSLLAHPEYQDLSRAQPLMRYLAQTENVGALTVPEGQTTSVLIGPENVHEALKDSSVVLATYDMGDNTKGVIGVVGPTRMDYATVLARLEYVAQSLSRLFERGQLPDSTEKEDP